MSIIFRLFLAPTRSSGSNSVRLSVCLSVCLSVIFMNSSLNSHASDALSSSFLEQS